MASDEELADLLYDNVVHRHFLWSKPNIAIHNSARPHQYAVSRIGATQSDDEPIMCGIAREPTAQIRIRG